MHATLSRACARLLSLAIALPVLLASERQQLPRVAEPELHGAVGEQNVRTNNDPPPCRARVVLQHAQARVLKGDLDRRLLLEQQRVF